MALVVKNPPANAGDIRDTGLIPVLWRSSGGGHGNSFQYSCLENPMDRGAWRATVHGVTKSQTWLKRLSMHVTADLKCKDAQEKWLEGNISTCKQKLSSSVWSVWKWMATTPVFLPGESHGQRSLVGYSPWGRKELHTTEWLHFLSLDQVMECLLFPLNMSVVLLT